MVTGRNDDSPLVVDPVERGQPGRLGGNQSVMISDDVDEAFTPNLPMPLVALMDHPQRMSGYTAATLMSVGTAPTTGTPAAELHAADTTTYSLKRSGLTSEGVGW